MVFFVLSLAPATALAQDAAEFPPPPVQGWTYDATGALDATTRRQIDAVTDATWRRAQVRLGVALVSDTGARTVEAYSLGLFRAWRMGEDTGGRGALLVVAVESRKNRIEIGTGLGDRLTDADAQRVLTEVFRPTARASGVGAAALRTLEALRAQVERPPAPAPTNHPSEELSFFSYLWRGLCGSVALIFFLSMVAGWLEGRQKRKEQAARDAEVEKLTRKAQAIVDAFEAEGFAPGLWPVKTALLSVYSARERYKKTPTVAQYRTVEKTFPDVEEATQKVRADRVAVSGKIQDALTDVDRQAARYREVASKLSPLLRPTAISEVDATLFAPLRARLNDARRRIEGKPCNPEAVLHEVASVTATLHALVTSVERLDAKVATFRPRLDATEKEVVASPDALQATRVQLTELASRWPRVDFSERFETLEGALGDVAKIAARLAAIRARLEGLRDEAEVASLDKDLGAVESEVRKLKSVRQLPADREAALKRAETDAASLQKRLDASALGAVRAQYGAAHPALVEAFAKAREGAEARRGAGDPLALVVALTVAQRALDAVHEAARPAPAPAASYDSSGASDGSGSSSDCSSSYSSDCASSDCASSDCSGSSSDW